MIITIFSYKNKYPEHNKIGNTFRKDAIIMLPSRAFFDHFFDEFDSARTIEKMMKCDIYEDGDNYKIEMDLPGYTKEDIAMELENGYLKIIASKNSDSKEQDRKYVRQERSSFEKCERQFYVGEIEEDKVKAKFKDGILEITIPNIKEKREEKKMITIED